MAPVQDLALAPVVLLSWNSRLRWLLAQLAWVASAALLAPLCFFAVMILACRIARCCRRHSSPSFLCWGGSSSCGFHFSLRVRSGIALAAHLRGRRLTRHRS